MNRRNFLRGLIAAAVAPAIIRTPGLTMPIKPGLVQPSLLADYMAVDEALANPPLLDVGGPSINRSIWLVSWGPKTVFGMDLRPGAVNHGPRLRSIGDIRLAS